MIHTNEYNNSINNQLKEQVKDLRIKREDLDIKKIHFNTQQLDKNKFMIEQNAHLKHVAKNPGGKPRNPKLDQDCR